MPFRLARSLPEGGRLLRRNRGFRALAASQLLTLLGDSALLLALAVWMKTLTGSTGSTGGVFLSFAVPVLGAPLLGGLVDRAGRRPVMLACTPVLTASVLALLAVVATRRAWVLYPVAVIYSTAAQLFLAARTGLVEQLVAEADLVTANGMLEGIRQLTRLLAPLGGVSLFVAYGGDVLAISDAMVLCVGGLLLLRVPAGDLPHRRDRHGDGGSNARIVRELTIGFRHLIGDAVLRQVTVVGSVLLGSAGLVEVAIFGLVAHGLHRSPGFVAVLVTIEGVGSISAALTTPALSRRVGLRSQARLATLCAGAGLGLLVTGKLYAVVGGMVLIGWGMSTCLIAYTSGVQLRTPAAMQGRVYLAGSAVTNTPFTVALAVSTFIVSAVGFRTVVAGSALLALGVAAVGGRVGDDAPCGPPVVRAPPGEQGEGLDEPVAPTDRPA